MITIDMIEAILTGILSFLSLFGSILVLLSYLIAARIGKTKVASKLIRNLAISDTIWFVAIFVISNVWIFGSSGGRPGSVPNELCFVGSPMVAFGRMSSLFWTCCISIDLLQSISRRTRNRRQASISSDGRPRSPSNTKREDLPITTTNTPERYYSFYYVFVYVLSLPGPVLTVILQHTTDSSNLGCDAGYEEMGEWFIVTAVQVLPIFIGISIIIFVFIQIRIIMASPYYPHSVRKRLRDVMYYYIIVCIICWLPTLAFYITALSGYQSIPLDMVARSSLYLTGFFNFLVYGMQDKYLRSAFRVALTQCGCKRFVSKAARPLKTNTKDKMVMFGQDVTDVQKEKNSVYKHRRLSKEDKSALYALRPDLNLHSDLEESLLNQDQADSDASFYNNENCEIDEESKDKIEDWDYGGDMHEDDSDSEDELFTHRDSTQLISAEQQSSSAAGIGDVQKKSVEGSVDDVEFYDAMEGGGGISQNDFVSNEIDVSFASSDDNDHITTLHPP